MLVLYHDTYIVIYRTYVYSDEIMSRKQSSFYTRTGLGNF